MDIFTTPPAPADDEFHTAYQGHRDERDAGAWRQHSAQARRPKAVQTLQDVQALVAEIAPRYGVDPKLVESVIGLESGGNPLAVSQKGAQGVMQLMPGCVTTDTEALTKRGWLSVENITPQDEFLTYSVAKGVCEWQKSLGPLVRYMAPRLIRIHGRSFDFIVTPDHKWVAYRGYSKTAFHREELRETTALMTKSPWYIRRTALYDWPVKTSLDDDIVELIGWVFTEGTIDQRLNRNGVAVYQKHFLYRQRIAQLLDRVCGHKQYREYCALDGRTRWLLPGHIAEVIIEYMGRPKRISVGFLSQLSYPQALLLYETCLAGDGWRSTTPGNEKKQPHTQDGFCQSHQGRMDDFQALACMLGRVTNVSQVRAKTLGIIRGIEYPQREKLQCHVSRRQTAYMPRLTFEEVGSGEVWCPTLPNGTWMARRLGRVTITGNTAQRFGVRDPLDAQQNIEGGIRYLAFLKSQFPGRTDLQLAGYHAGEGAVRNAGYNIPQTSDGHMTTQQYVQNVMGRYQAPQGQDGTQPSPAPAAPGQATQPPAQAPQTPQDRVKMLGTALPGVATPAPVVDAGMAVPPPRVSLLPDQTQTTPTLSPLAQPFPPLEEGVSEPRIGRMVGAIGAGAVGMVKGLFNAMIAGQTLVGMTEPGKPDPIRADLVVNVLDKVQQELGERRGGAPQDFWDKLGSGIGTSLVSLVPAAGAMGFLRGVAQVAPRLARWGGAVTSGIIEAAAEGGSLFEQMKPRVGEDEAAKRALMSFGQNMVLITATDRLGIFGDQATLLRRTLAGVVTNAAQEEMQYDVERRQLWVPANHKAAEALQQQGWVQSGDKLIKPYSPKDAVEAMLLGAMIGGPAAAGVGLAAQEVSTPWQNLAAREREAAGGTLDPNFSMMNVFKAAQNQPVPAGVEPEAWQRWGNYLKDLLPQPTGGPGILASERGSLQLFRSSGMARQMLPESQVRDAEGNLQRMYHGTGAAFEQFDPAQQGAGAGGDLYGPGFYFTDSPVVGSEYAQGQTFETFQEESAATAAAASMGTEALPVRIGGEIIEYKVPSTRAGANVRPVYLDIQRPFDAETETLDPQQIATLAQQTLDAWGATGNATATTLLQVTQGRTEPLTYEALADRISKPETNRLLQRLGYDGITHEGGQVTGGEAHKVYIAFEPEQIHPAVALEAQAATGVSGTAAPGAAAPPSDLTVDIPPTDPGMEQLTLPGSLLSGGQPTLRGGAEGIPQEQYRTPSGDWVIPRKNIPLTELELKDFIGEMKGIQLEGEELQGELRALISPSETGIRGLQNNVRGVSLQEMAEIAQQYEFIRTADKEALLEALDRSVNLGQKVYSMQATGRIPLLHDPHVRGTYQAVLDAVEIMQERTAEQVGGVRARAERHAEAREMIEAGLFTPDDIREILPNTTLNDTMASALVQQLHDIAVNLGNAAESYLQQGARIGSQEETSLQQSMALLAELDPTRLGVSAAQSRGLGILNDPLSGYTQYLNALHKVLASAPNRTMEQIAKKIVAARPQPTKDADYWKAHPEELALAFTDMQAVIARFAASPLTGQVVLPLSREQAPQGELGIGFQLEPTQPDTEAELQLSPEERALVASAYNPQGPARTPEEWYALYRTAYHQEWKESMASLQALQADLRQGYAGRPADMPAGPQEAPHFERGEHARQFTLFDTYADVQQALTDLREGRATQDQEEALRRVMEPWTATQEQLSIPTLKAALQSTKPGFEEFFLELWFNALLSSPTTHATNILSNTVTAVWALPERFVAEQFSHGRAGGVARGESAALLYGLTHGIQGSWAGAVRSWKAKQPVSRLGRETFREPALTASNLGMNPESGLGQFADFLFEYIGVASGGRLAGRALMAADEFFYLWNYYGNLNALAYRDAVRQGHEGRAFASHIASIVTKPNLSAIREAAHNEAVLNTFQKPIEPGAWGAGAQWFANLRIPLGFDQTFPIGRVLVPWIQTPVNIAQYAMDRTLMAPLFASFRADIEAGKTEAGRARADTAMAKVTLGTVAMVAMAAFAASGRLVGRGPEDPDLRAIWRESNEEYSLRLPTGHWMSYRWMGWLGQIMGGVADAVQILGEADEPLYIKLIAAPTYSFLKNIGNATFMGQLNEFFDAMWPGYSGRDSAWAEWGKGMGRWAKRQGAQLVQPSSFLNTLARAIDPAEKQATEFKNMVYKRIPGWGGPSQRTLGGEKVLYGWGIGPDLLANTIRAYSPLKLGEGRIYPADLAILENKMSLNKPARSLVPHALPPGMQAQGFTEVDLAESGGLRLDDQQYEKYQVLAGGNQVEAKKLGLDIPNQLLDAVVDGLSSSFAKRPPRGTRSLDDYAHWMVQQPEFVHASPDPGGLKETMYQQAVRTYRMVGLQLLLAQDAPLRQRYEESQMALQTKQLPLGERQPVIDEMRRGYREAAPRVREELGLRVGGP